MLSLKSQQSREEEGFEEELSGFDLNELTSSYDVRGRSSPNNDVTRMSIDESEVEQSYVKSNGITNNFMTIEEPEKDVERSRNGDGQFHSR
jgi:hypothetical protein